MKTQDLLDTLNGAIAEYFAPFIGKKFKFGNVHGLVQEIIKPLLPESLEYHIWTIGPQTHKAEGYEFLAHDVELFRLNTDGFQKYKNSSKYETTGKWLRAPRYEVMAAVAFPTVEGVIKRGMRKKFDKLIFENKQALIEHQKAVDDKIEYIEELIQSAKKYDTLNDPINV
jgi:hypothetical protein